MRLVFVSDLHLKGIDPPEGDILFNCGDMTMNGRNREIEWYKDWLMKQKSKYQQIVWIAGNHDYEASNWGPKLAGYTNTIYLENSGCKVEGLNIWGSPYTPTFGYWAFMKSRGNEIRKVWDKIPEKLDVLITHGPPYTVLDEIPLRGEHVGCWDLLDIVKQRKPRIHAFGHIHYSYGKSRKFDTLFINAAICTEQYTADNAPIIVEI